MMQNEMSVTETNILFYVNEVSKIFKFVKPTIHEIKKQTGGYQGLRGGGSGKYLFMSKKSPDR